MARVGKLSKQRGPSIPFHSLIWTTWSSVVIEQPGFRPRESPSILCTMASTLQPQIQAKESCYSYPLSLMSETTSSKAYTLSIWNFFPLFSTCTVTILLASLGISGRKSSFFRLANRQNSERRHMCYKALAIGLILLVFGQWICQEYRIKGRR